MVGRYRADKKIGMKMVGYALFELRPRGENDNHHPDIPKYSKAHSQKRHNITYWYCVHPKSAALISHTKDNVSLCLQIKHKIPKKYI